MSERATYMIGDTVSRSTDGEKFFVVYNGIPWFSLNGLEYNIAVTQKVHNWSLNLSNKYGNLIPRPPINMVHTSVLDVSNMLLTEKTYYWGTKYG